MIRICCVLDRLDMQADYVQIIEGLAKRGHRVCTLLHRPPKTRRPDISNLEVSVAKEPLLLDRISIVNTLLLKAINAVKRHNSDVIYATGTRLGEGLLAGLLTHKPVLCDVRNPWSTQREELAERVALKTILGNYATRIRFFSEELLITKADRIVAYSQGIRDWLISYLAVPEDKITVIPPHVDTSIFRPDLDGEIVRSKYKIGNVPVIMYAGAIMPSRGIDLLIEAFAGVKGRFDSAKLMIIGPLRRSISPFLKDLKHKISLLRLEGNVIFTDYVPFGQVPSYIAAADVLVLPSRRTFTFEISPPVKVLEYMASQKPIVVTDVGIRDFVRDGENGIIVKPEDIDALAGAIMRLLRDPCMAQRLAYNARMFVEKSLREEMMIESFENILVSLARDKV